MKHILNSIIRYKLFFFRQLLLIAILFVTFQQLRAEYQYRPIQDLNKVYNLEIPLTKVSSFEMLMHSYQQDVFSNPDATNLTIQEIKKLHSGELYQFMVTYLTAKSLSAQSKYTEAYQLISELVKENKLAGILKADILVLHGRISKTQNKMAATLKSYVEAKEIYLNHPDYLGLSIVEINLAEFYRATTALDKAMLHINKAITLIQKHDLPELIDLYRINRQCAILSESGKHDEAILLTNQSIAIAGKINNKFLLASATNELGVLYDFKQAYAKSHKCFLEAISIWKETGHIRYWTSTVHHLARYYETVGDQDACISLIEQNLPLLKEKNWVDVLNSYYGIMSRAYLAKGDYKMAMILSDTSQQYLRAHVEAKITKELAVQEANFQIQKLRTEKERNSKQRNIAIIIAVIICGLLIYMIRQESLKRKINEKLHLTLNEREILIKEIHHRVKNNLQIIASLLYLQSDDVENKTVKKLLEEGQGRVRSMALIHQKLYENDDLKSIPFEEYLNELILEIRYSFGQRAENIQLQVDAKEIYFDVDTAVPLGLIINELSTNAFKYAFDKRLGGTFKVHLEKNGKDYKMQVSDNGVGIPDDQLNKNSSKSLGLKLTKMLSEQLEGEYAFNNENGTTFNLKFAV